MKRAAPAWRRGAAAAALRWPALAVAGFLTACAAAPVAPPASTAALPCAHVHASWYVLRQELYVALLNGGTADVTVSDVALNALPQTPASGWRLDEPKRLLTAGEIMVRRIENFSLPPPAAATAKPPRHTCRIPVSLTFTCDERAARDLPMSGLLPGALTDDWARSCGGDAGPTT